MKINGSTHMTILISFAIVFVGLYLYYTISDVRKMAVDFKRLSVEVSTLTTNVTTLVKDVSTLQQSGVDVAKMFNMNEMLTKELNGLLKVEVVQQAVVDDDDDVESVDTSDIKKMLNDDDDDDDDDDKMDGKVTSIEDVVASTE